MKLSPCPFCGAQAKVRKLKMDLPNRYMYMVECSNDTCRIETICKNASYGFPMPLFWTRGSAVKWWNQRRSAGEWWNQKGKRK